MKNTIPPPFSSSPFLNLQTVQAPFLDNSPYILDFCEPPYNVDFSVNLHNIKILILKGAFSELRVFGKWKLLKNDEKCFLFHLKISFRSQDI